MMKLLRLIALLYSNAISTKAMETTLHEFIALFLGTCPLRLGSSMCENFTQRVAGPCCIAMLYQLRLWRGAYPLTYSFIALLYSNAISTKASHFGSSPSHFGSSHFAAMEVYLRLLKLICSSWTWPTRCAAFVVRLGFGFWVLGWASRSPSVWVWVLGWASRSPSVWVWGLEP